MITKNIRFTLSAISLFATVFVASTKVNAAPVRFSQVTQVVDSKPGKASSGNYTRLRLASDPVNDPVNDPKNDGGKSGAKPAPQDDRVITETSYELEQIEDCDCPIDRKSGRFPYWTLLGLAAIPLVIVLRDDDPTPTPTPPTMTPTMTMTPTPTATMTPTMTPTPPTEPVPEPMTILLFGTGLAGVGLAARRKFGRREEDEEASEE